MAKKDYDATDDVVKNTVEGVTKMVKEGGQYKCKPFTTASTSLKAACKVPDYNINKGPANTPDDSTTYLEHMS